MRSIIYYTEIIQVIVQRFVRYNIIILFIIIQYVQYYTPPTRLRIDDDIDRPDGRVILEEGERNNQQLKYLPTSYQVEANKGPKG